MQERPSRRTVLATAGSLALSGLAGCAGGGDDDATTAGPSTDDATTAGSSTDDATATTDSDPTDTQSTTGTADAPDVDWNDVSPFRTWITDYSTIPGSNHRFDYQAAALEDTLAGERTDVLDLSADDLDGVLFQSANVFFFGEFDVDAVVDALSSDDDHEMTGEHEGFELAEGGEAGTEFAVGSDAIGVGSELTHWVDAHVGERDRLEETDPVFTRILRRLPDREFVTAQYGAPAGGEIDGEYIDAWGTSMSALDAETATWVYALDPDAGSGDVEDLESELEASAFTESIADRETDGRLVTFTATVDMPE